MEIDLKQLFSHSPDEFDIHSGMAWERPCEIHLNLYLTPKSEATKRDFWSALVLPFCIDAFSKATLEKQFDSVFWKLLNCMEQSSLSLWYWELSKWNSSLKEQLRHPDTMFRQPFRFVGRDKFVTADLPTVLKENPERMEVYLAEEERTYANYCFLRIHSNLWHFAPEARHLWFEKRLPSGLQPEDVLPWFMATINRLPKRMQPSNPGTWVERLSLSDPKLSPQQLGKDQPWTKKPKVILVFGATHKVGYRSLFHLERSRIIRLTRNRELLTIIGQIQYGLRSDQALSWTFHLITADETAARHVEQEMIDGKTIHFGLDVNIVGMVARTDGVVHSINVPVDKVRSLCLTEGESLESPQGERNKHKIYQIVRSSTKSPSPSVPRSAVE